MKASISKILDRFVPFLSLEIKIFYKYGKFCQVLSNKKPAAGAGFLF